MQQFSTFVYNKDKNNNIKYIFRRKRKITKHINKLM